MKNDGWDDVRTTWRSMKRNWVLLGSGDRAAFICHQFVGHLLMASAIIAQFGWNGFVFCAGFALWKVTLP